ncbi:putative leader peptide [Streptomyces sp. NPDC006658]|uniref:putative leader peptide n=1 Tax=unclassified Streptomyces TaxID=2593676 RepID=UPI0033D16CDC
MARRLQPLQRSRAQGRDQPARPAPGQLLTPPGNNPRRPGVDRLDEIHPADADPARRVRRREATAVTRVPDQARPPRPYRSVRLHSRPHIDLQRVSAALCRR